ncbi:MAG: anthranilate synthase component I, partial [Xanthomonadales bacterium]|nr:anthranilate synthase component I [Xanthomonadales bacterium]
MTDAINLAELRAAGYTRVPVVRHVRADLDTPLSAYLKLVDGTDAYLLESVEGSDTWGRYSIIGLPARERIEVRGRQWRRLLDGVCVEERE